MPLRTIWTWNVNGLDEARLDERTELQCLAVLLREDRPDVLFLQEVVRRSWHAHWKHHLRAAGYAVTPEDPTATRSTYFALAAVRAELAPTNGRAAPFPGTDMGRALVTVEAGGWLFATGHLESGRAASAERVAQLGIVCARLAAHSGPAAFAGDTNLRVEEEPLVPGLAGVRDAWSALGAPSAERATWLGGKFGARFDRVLVNERAQPVSFRREAVDPVEGVGRLSDHAALVAVVDG